MFQRGRAPLRGGEARVARAFTQTRIATRFTAFIFFLNFVLRPHLVGQQIDGGFLDYVGADQCFPSLLTAYVSSWLKKENSNRRCGIRAASRTADLRLIPERAARERIRSRQDFHSPTVGSPIRRCSASVRIFPEGNALGATCRNTPPPNSLANYVGPNRRNVGKEHGDARCRRNRPGDRPR